MAKKKNKKLEKFLEKAEDIVDILIFPATILLAFLIAGNFFLHLEDYEPYVTLADYFIISLFVVDLGFKWKHTHNLRKFFRFYWLDILAIFPFYLITRTYLGFLELTGGANFQEVLHTITGLRESQIFREVKLLRNLRGIRLGQRLIRIIALRFKAAHRVLLLPYEWRKKRKRIKLSRIRRRKK